MPERLPDWPRRMDVRLAAAYLGISRTHLLRHAGGKYPAGVRDGGRVHWYREDLDACLDRLRAGAPSSPGDPYLEGLARLDAAPPVRDRAREAH